jgi:transcriptional regulator with XRE-family HTH domain
MPRSRKPKSATAPGAKNGAKRGKPSRPVVKLAKVDLAAFEDMLKARGATKTDLGRALGIDQPTVTRLLRGERLLQVGELPDLCNFFQIPPEAALELFGVVWTAQGITSLGSKRQEAESVPVVGWVDGAFQVHEEGLRGDKLVHYPLPDRQGIRALRYQTRGSAFAAFDGWVVFFRAIETTGGRVNPEVIGKYCVVAVSGEKGLKLRVVQKGYKGGLFNLTNLNGTLVEEEVRVDAASPVVFMKN